MICANCESLLPDTNIKQCTKCCAIMHIGCAFQCVKCGAFLCDKCAMSQKYLCDICYNFQSIKMEYISATMFESYEKCPYSFKQEHVLNVFTEAERENKYSVIGKLLHDIFDKYSQIRPLDFNTETTAVNEFMTGFDLINIKLFDSINDRALFRERGFLTLNNWLKEEIERPVPLYTEKQHFIMLDGIDIPIRATIDRINGAGENSSEWEVEDYKTGKVYSSDMLRHNFQLPIYALAIQKTYGALPKKLCLRFPQHTNRTGNVQQRIFEKVSNDVYICKVPRGGTYSFSLMERLAKMQEIYNKIKRDDFPLNTSNSHFCDSFCTLSRNGMCDGLSTKWKVANQRGY